MMLAQVSLAEGSVVLLLTIILQYLFAWTASTSKKMERIINDVPSLIFYDGKFIAEGMAKESITKTEIFSMIRSSGIEHIDDLKAVVMEVNGELTIVMKSEGNGRSSLEDIETL